MSETERPAAHIWKRVESLPPGGHIYIQTVWTKLFLLSASEIQARADISDEPLNTDTRSVFQLLLRFF